MRHLIWSLGLVLVGCAHSSATASTAIEWSVTTTDENEEARLAQQVVDGLVTIAKQANLPPVRIALQTTPEGFTAELTDTTGTRSVSLPLAPHVFSGATWAPLAAALLGPPPNSMRALRSYVLSGVEKDLSARTLAKLAATVGGEMKAAPLAPGGHEKASLVLVGLALREGGPLADPREALALATAHLAASERLQENPVQMLDAAAAQSLIHALVGDETSASRTVNSYQVRMPWTPAVMTLVNGDWRRRSNAPAPAMGLDFVTLYRELRRRGGAEQSQDVLEKWKPAPDALWARAVFTWTRHQPVVVARQYGENLPAFEAEERRSLEEDVANPLGEFVIPAEVWSRHLARNEMGAALVQQSVFGFTLRSVEHAEALVRSADAAFANEPQWPAARLLFEREPSNEDCERGVKALNTLTPRARERAAIACRTAKPVHEPLTPRNTAYDADERLSTNFPRDNPAELERLSELAPSSYGARAQRLALVPRNRLSTDKALDIMGPLIAYDLRAIEFIEALQLQPSRELLEASCELESNNCAAVVNYLRDRDLPEVIGVLERWRQRPLSRVAFSQLSRPLLDFYFEEGRLADAAALASEVGGTKSGNGLEIEAVYFERMGKYREAERGFTAIAERYGEPFFLDDFYLRAAFRRYQRGAFVKQGKEAEQRLFDGALVKVTKGALSVDDTQGVPMGSERDPAYRRFGFKRGDLLLSADGFRIKTQKQLLALLHRSETPTLTAVVIRDGRLVELTGPFRRQRYGR